ncbi:MAG: GNAT family N-acetyltransferase [Planctomycetota bacterium]
MCFRAYEAEKDKDAIHRIWYETGWIESGHERQMDLFVEAGRSWVADVNGGAECLVLTAPGTVRYVDTDLTMSCVTAVTTSRVARKQGFAAGLTARAIAADVADGALISALGMFEQGFYNRLGFGTGGYEHLVSFAPAALRVGGRGSGAARPRVPRRITPDDWEMVHANRLRRHRGHGACNLESADLTRAEMLEHKNGFGLGFADGPDGALSHHLWGSAPSDVESGPYRVEWLAWETPAQLLELLGLIKNLGDQVALIRIREPAGVQLQDLLDKPFARYTVSEGSKFENRAKAIAYWQMRICDLPQCLARTKLGPQEARFNLRLTDSIEGFLPDDAPWRGTGGDYVVTLGPSSGAEHGSDTALPTLAATVNAFTRLWLGVRPATGLSLTDDLDGPRELLEQLDAALRLPDPHPDWDF